MIDQIGRLIQFAVHKIRGLQRQGKSIPPVTFVSIIPRILRLLDTAPDVLMIQTLFSKPLASAGLLFLLSIASPAYSAIVTSDWQSKGDGLLTVDLDSGLEWLNLRQTMTGNSNRSYLDVVSQTSVGGEFEGFRHATESELLSLWTSAGITDIDAGGTTSNFAPISALIIAIGSTSPNPIASEFSFGILADSNSVGTHQAGMIEIINPDRGRARPDLQNVPDTATNISGGHYLVRAVAIPEPSSLPILSVISAGCLVRRRSRAV